jgi:hypothetical protein
MPYYLLYTACLIIGSYSVAILFGVLTARRLKLDNFRENARIQKLHSQFNRIVIIQVGQINLVINLISNLLVDNSVSPCHYLDFSWCCFR